MDFDQSIMRFHLAQCIDRKIITVALAIANNPQSSTPDCLWILTEQGTAEDPKTFTGALVYVIIQGIKKHLLGLLFWHLQNLRSSGYHVNA